jgi:hypothetical protein
MILGKLDYLDYTATAANIYPASTAVFRRLPGRHPQQQLTTLMTSGQRQRREPDRVLSADPRPLVTSATGRPMARMMKTAIHTTDPTPLATLTKPRSRKRPIWTAMLPPTFPTSCSACVATILRARSQLKMRSRWAMMELLNLRYRTTECYLRA